ncbi:TolC family protein [Flectobacillus roseus]
MKKLTVFGLILCAQMTFAQDKNTDALGRLVKAAIDYSPRIKEQQQLVSIGDYKTKIQEAALKPQVQSELSVTRIDPVAKASFAFGSTSTELSFQPNMNYNANVGANYTIADWGKQALAIERAKLETNLSKNNVEGLKQNYAYQVANLYYGIVYLQKAIEVQKEQLKLVANNEKLISDRLKQGDALDYDRVSIQVRYKNAETRLTDLQGQLDRQLIYLSSLIGADARTMVPTDADFSATWADLTVSAAFEQAQTNNIDLKNIKEKDLIADQDVKIAQLSMAPTVSAVGQLGIKNGYLPRINGEVPPVDKDFKFNTVLGLKMTIPIYAGGRGAYSTEMAKLSKEMLKYSSEATNQALKRDLDAAENDYTIAKNKLDLSEKNVFQAQYALKLAESRYKNGVITNVEIEAAQTALREAQLTQLQYQYMMTQAKLEVSRLSGLKFW